MIQLIAWYWRWKNIMREWLDEGLSDRDLYLCREMCRELERYKQEGGEASDEFVDKFERYYKLVAASNREVEILDAIRVSMILRKANLMDTQRMLIIRRIIRNKERTK